MRNLSDHHIIIIKRRTTMKYKIEIRYAVWHRSSWEVEAPDEANAEKVAESALTGYIEESVNCRRTDPDESEEQLLGAPSNPIVEIVRS
jgi:hypothetical protein